MAIEGMMTMMMMMIAHTNRMYNTAKGHSWLARYRVVSWLVRNVFDVSLEPITAKNSLIISNTREVRVVVTVRQLIYVNIGITVIANIKYVSIHHL